MSYDSEVLADSPWFYGKTDEASGNLLDSSGNSRTLTVTGTPNYAITGPDGSSADGISWNSGTTPYATSTATLGSTATALTLECWFYLPSTATTGGHVDTPTALVGVIYGVGNGSKRPAQIYLDTDGQIKLWWGSSSTLFTVIAATQPSLDAWHHVVGVLTSTTGKLRVDKVDVASGSQATAIDGTGFFAVHTGGNATGVVNVTNGDTMRIAKPALYLSSLSNARIDAHRDAMIPPTRTGTLAATLPHPLTAGVSGTYTPPTRTGTLSATLPHPLTASLSGTYQAPPTGTFAAALPPVTASLSATYTPPPVPVGTFDAALPFPTAEFTGTYTPPLRTGTLDATLPGLDAALSGTYLPLEVGTLDATLPTLVADLTGTYHALGETGTFAAVLPGLAVALVGTYDGATPTDTSNSHNGRRRNGRATVTIDRPVAPTPPGVTFGQRYDKALAYPVPVMVDGRPT